jgi:hypothetical protein
LFKSRLVFRGYVADLFADPRSDAPMYHFTLTREGEDEIIAIGQETTFEAAQRAAQDAITFLAESEAARA